MSRIGKTILSRHMVLAIAYALLQLPHAHAGQFAGMLGGELRYFPQTPLDEQQFEGMNLSVYIEPEYLIEWSEGTRRIFCKPYLRIDQHDDQRTHWDLRELYYAYYGSDWGFLLGVSQVFWGVTESKHLVDVINQTDYVDTFDDEKKLGQPMLNLTLLPSWGTVELYALIGFRERTFPSPEGRLRTTIPVEHSSPVYESPHERYHIDLAARWEHSFDIYDLGLAFFDGTCREPRFQIEETAPDEYVLLPLYDLMRQASVDLQVTLEDWLWKLEALVRKTEIETHTAATGGFEYTRVGVMGSQLDLGLVTEYSYDQRGKQILSPYDNDLFAGARLLCNNSASTEFLAGIAFDLDVSSKLIHVEGSHRISENCRVLIEGAVFTDVAEEDVLYNIHRDDFLQLSVELYF